MGCRNKFLAFAGVFTDKTGSLSQNFMTSQLTLALLPLQVLSPAKPGSLPQNFMTSQLILALDSRLLTLLPDFPTMNDDL
jgi:hypothetical protein